MYNDEEDNEKNESSVNVGGRPKGKEVALTYLHREIKASAKTNERLRRLTDRILDRVEKYLKDNPAPEAAFALLEPLNNAFKGTNDALSKLGAIAVKYQEASKEDKVETKDGDQLLEELLR